MMCKWWLLFMKPLFNFKHMTWTQFLFSIFELIQSSYMQRHCFIFCFDLCLCLTSQWNPDWRIKDCFFFPDPRTPEPRSQVTSPLLVTFSCLYCTLQLCHIFLCILYKTVYEILFLCTFVSVLPPSVRFCILILQQQAWACCSYWLLDYVGNI